MKKRDGPPGRTGSVNLLSWRLLHAPTITARMSRPSIPSPTASHRAGLTSKNLGFGGILANNTARFSNLSNAMLFSNRKIGIKAAA
jgi:hypothetical protein